MIRDSRVFTIAPGVPFLPTLADALFDGRLLGTPLDGCASDAILYLPTRRAARALTEILVERAGGRAQLLPRIVPLGDVDQTEFELAAASVDAGFESAAALAPPIPALERRLILAQLIQGWAKTVDRRLLKLRPEMPFLVPSSPADAMALAADLEALMDSLTIEDVPWNEIASAVDSEFSEYFRLTLAFVRIAVENWPDILKERGASDPARRRHLLISAEAQRLMRERPQTPIVAAGSTGSMPATAALLAATARLPNGAVVLPGLDLDLDEDAWEMVDLKGNGDAELVHGHPQALMRRLLKDHLRLARADVQTLGTAGPRAEARARVLSEALRPADTTDRWAAMPADDHAALTANGLEGIAILEAADEREEALAAAIALRETLEEPGRTAALVTPDRSLATRVAAELRRWGLAVEDSAGVPLSETPAGRLARLAAEAATAAGAPAVGSDRDLPLRLLALVAHPLVRLGLGRDQVERAAAALEIGVLRGPAPSPGFAGLFKALELCRAEKSRHTPRPRRRLRAQDWDRAADLLRRLAEAMAPFTEQAREGELDLVDLTKAHRAVIEALLASRDDEVAEESIEPLERLFDDLATADEGGGVRGRFADYPAFFAALARGRTIAPATASHARVKILGLLEARLLSADRIVLGGLDEGVWPPRVETDAFLNRPMRARLGLSSPEQRIGQTAHDFVQLLGTPDVLVTRAAKRNGAPMVPSRFLQRLRAFAGKGASARMTERGELYRGLARLLATPRPAPPLKRPAPKPDPALFPRALSVTEIETLLRDPYAIYAKHILKLDALAPIAAPPGAADRGTLLHDIIGRFAIDHPRDLPPDAIEQLIQRGADAFRSLEAAYPELHAEWWPRFERLAAAFIEWDADRRTAFAEVLAERSGRLEFPLPGGEVFSLRARADRIEARADGSYAIVDFKTGQPPGIKEVFAGFSPQLTLEAAMLMEGGFEGIPSARETPDLLYVQISGGREPLKTREIETPNDDHRSVAQTVAEHRRRLEGLVARYASGETGYLSRPFPKFARKYSDYDHLARVKEWSLAGANGEEGEG